MNEARRLIHSVLVADNLTLEYHLLKHRHDLLVGYAAVLIGNSVVEQSVAFLEQSFKLQIQVPVFVASRIEGGVYRAVYSHRIVELAIALANDSIHSLKSEARYLTQFKGIVLKDLHALGAEMLVDLHCRCRCYVVGREKHHNTSEASALVVGSFDFLQLCGRNTSYLQQAFRLLFENLKSVSPEAFNDKFGCHFSDAFDEARGKVAEHTVFGLRNDLFARLNLQLRSVFSVLPLAAENHTDSIGLG